MPNTQKQIDRVCKYRGLPEIKMGTPCEVDGKKGVIVGGNTAANLNVLFENNDTARNCHPGYKMRIFNPWGGVIYESDDMYESDAPAHEPTQGG